MCVRVQGEQCNVVPDTIDDIVADIGQEEKHNGTVCTNTHTHAHTGARLSVIAALHSERYRNESIAATDRTSHYNKNTVIT